MSHPAARLSIYQVECLDTPDLITVLRAVDSTRLAAKTFSLNADGDLDVKQYDRIKTWRGEVLEVNTLSDLEQLLRKLERDAGACIVRGDIRSGADARRMNRRSVDSDDQLADLIASDHHWLCVDLDGVEAPASFDLEDASTWRAAIAEIVERDLPPCFRGRAAIAQWSSSAGMKPGVSLHLWYWSSRAVCSTSLRHWLLGLKKAGASLADPALFSAAQVHYVARPLFTGGAVDPMALRLFKLGGIEHVDLPEVVVADAERVRLEEKKQAERAELAQASRLQREERAERARASRSLRRRSAPAHKRSDSDEASDDITRQAGWLANAAIERMRSASKGERDSIRRDACYTLGGLVEHLPERDLLAEALDATSDLFAGEAASEVALRLRRTEVNFHQGEGRSISIDPREERRRSRSTTRGAAPSKASTSTKSTNDDATTAAPAPSAEREHMLVDDVAQLEEVDTMTVQVPTGETVQVADPFVLDDLLDGMLDGIDGLGELSGVDSLIQGWSLASETIEVEDLEQGRLEIQLMIASALESDDVAMLKASPGLGKSRAMMHELIARARRAQALRIVVVLPTHALCAEMMRAYQYEAPDIHVDHATTRTKDSCAIFDDVRAFGDIVASLSSRRCRECDMHPDNLGDDSSTCPVMMNRRARGAQIQFMTSALWQVTATDLEEDERPDLVVVDESVWGVCMIAEELTIANIGELIANGELSSRRNVVTERGETIPATEALLRLCARSLEDGHRIKTEKLRDLIGSSLIYEADEDLTEKIYVTARAMRTSKETIEYLNARVGWKARKALRACINDGWRGAYLQHGVLRVAASDSFVVASKQATIILDATANSVTTRALFGNDCAFEEITIALPEHVSVVKVNAEFGPNSHIGPGSTPSKIAQARYASTLEWLEANDKLLFITMKKWLTEGSTSRSIIDQLIVERGAHVLHHNGVEARGSNAYRECSTIFVPHYKAPVGAVEQAGQVLSRMLGEEYNDENKEAWHKLARDQIEGAALAQVAARCRYLDATAENPKRIIYAAPHGCTADILGAGDAVEVYDADELLYKVAGIPTSEALPDVIASLVSIIDVVAPSKMNTPLEATLTWDAILPTPSPRLQAVLEMIANSTPDPETVAKTRAADDLSALHAFATVACKIKRITQNPCQWILNQVRSTHGGDWSSLAILLKSFGVEHLVIEVAGRGVGKAFHVFVDEGLFTTKATTLLVRHGENLAARAGADAWRFQGAKVWRNVHLIDKALINAFAEVGPINPEEETQAAYFERLAQAEAIPDDWSARKLARAIARNKPSYKSTLQHLIDEAVKALARRWAFEDEIALEYAEQAAYRASEYVDGEAYTPAAVNARYCDTMEKLRDEWRLSGVKSMLVSTNTLVD